MDMVNTNGQMAESIQEIGSSIKCTAPASSLGPTAVNTKANITMTRSMATVSLPGPMVASMTAHGEMESKRAWVSTIMQRGM